MRRPLASRIGPLKERIADDLAVDITPQVIGIAVLVWGMAETGRLTLLDCPCCHCSWFHLLSQCG